MLAVRRVPRLLAALHMRMAEQVERLTTQMATHEMLGSLIGARRPTVSLALRELTDNGAIVHRDDGWLLLERPAKAAPVEPGHDMPHLVLRSGAAWIRSSSELAAPTLMFSTLVETVDRLRAQHELDRERIQERLRRSSEATRHARETRRRVQRERRLRTPRLPSS